MTEYWKSTPKHYCEVCRLWIADTPRIVQEHERSNKHQERLGKHLAALRRKEEKEANDAARIRSAVNDIESKAFASYTRDLEEGASKVNEKIKPVRKSVPADRKLHKGKRKLTLDVPQQCADIGGYTMPKTGKIGGAQRIVRQPVHTTRRSKKPRVNEDEEAKARRLRDEARERVKQRNMLNFGLG